MRVSWPSALNEVALNSRVVETGETKEQKEVKELK
jgi:hypothetical protein